MRGTGSSRSTVGRARRIWSGATTVGPERHRTIAPLALPPVAGADGTSPESGDGPGIGRATATWGATFPVIGASMVRSHPLTAPGVIVARRALTALLVIAAFLLPTAGRATAAGDAPTMTARVLLQGHVRLGSWIAIQVHLHNDGPSVNGELRLQGGSEGGTRYATPVQLDT